MTPQRHVLALAAYAVLSNVGYFGYLLLVATSARPLGSAVPFDLIAGGARVLLVTIAVLAVLRVASVGLLWWALLLATLLDLASGIWRYHDTSILTGPLVVMLALSRSVPFAMVWAGWRLLRMGHSVDNPADAPGATLVASPQGEPLPARQILPVGAEVLGYAAEEPEGDESKFVRWLAVVWSICGLSYAFSKPIYSVLVTFTAGFKLAPRFSWSGSSGLLSVGVSASGYVAVLLAALAKPRISSATLFRLICIAAAVPGVMIWLAQLIATGSIEAYWLITYMIPNAAAVPVFVWILLRKQR